MELPCQMQLRTQTIPTYFLTITKENPLAIGVKGARVLEILNLIPGERVNNDVAESARPLLLSPVDKQENQQILALQMPMLLVD